MPDDPLEDPPDEELLVLPLDELLEPLDPLEELLVSPQNAARALPQVTSLPAHVPSTHAPARYEEPLEHEQQVGWQSAYVEQLEPGAPFPVSFSGVLGQEPFTCSA